MKLFGSWNRHMVFTLVFLTVIGNVFSADGKLETTGQSVVLEDAEKWRPVLYRDKNFKQIENQVEELLSKIPDELASGTLTRLYDALSDIPQDAVIVEMKEVLEEWSKASPDSHIPWLVKGEFLINDAWRIRGGDWAEKVPEEAWPLFHQQLESASVALQKAFDLNPKDPNSSAALITVSTGLGLEKNQMERYFQSAIAADPAHLRARMNKLFYLKPKWHGSLEEMYAFARQCQTESARFPMVGVVLVEAHDENHRILKRADKKSNHLGSEDVWKDIRDIYENILKRYPDYVRARFYYAYYAYRAGQNRIAADQFEVIENRWALDVVWENLEEYNKARTKTYTALANEAMKNQHYDQAEAMFLKVVGIDPRNGNAYLNLSWINGEFKRDMRKTKEYAQKALTCELTASQEASARNYITMADRIGGS